MHLKQYKLNIKQYQSNNLNFDKKKPMNRHKKFKKNNILNFFLKKNTIKISISFIL